MGEPKAKRPWWRKKRWWSAAALLFLPPPLYLLGGGPVYYYALLSTERVRLGLHDHTSVIWGAVWHYAYVPVALSDTSFADFWHKYYLVKWEDQALADVGTEAVAAKDAELEADRAGRFVPDKR